MMPQHVSMDKLIAIAFPIDFEGHENIHAEPLQENIRPKIKSFVQYLNEGFYFGSILNCTFCMSTFKVKTYVAGLN